MAKHGAGPIKGTENSFTYHHQVGSEKGRPLTGKQESEWELQITINRLIFFPMGFPSGL